MLKNLYYWFHRKTSSPEERGEYSSGYWQDRVRRESLGLCKDAGGRLLEAGCGEGLFLAELALGNKDIEIYGIDNRKEILEEAGRRFKENGIKNVILSRVDAGSLPFEDCYFDTVVCINVIFNLESLDAVKKVISEITRVGKKGGRVIFDFRNSRNPFLYFKYKLAPYYDPTVRNLPLNTYSLKVIHRLLGKAGLKIISRKTVGFPIDAVAPIIILETEKI